MKHLSVKFNSVKYVCIAVKLSSRTFSPCKTETLYPLNNSSFPPLPAPEPLNHFLFLKDFIYSFLDRGEEWEKERERNISVWLSLKHPVLGTWPTTQACVLTRNPTGNLLVCSPHSIHGATPIRAPIPLSIAMSLIILDTASKQNHSVCLFVTSLFY